MIGFSIYQQNYSLEYIKLMSESGFTDAFISLHVNEEISDKEAVSKYLSDLEQFKLNLIADVSPVTFKQFTIIELKNFRIDTLRIDYGFTINEIYELSKEFQLVLNASTLTQEDLCELKKLEFDFSKVTLMHNFYPKVETGLSLNQLKIMNEKYHKMGFKVLTFIPGDDEYRGPIFEGLPTIEEHRYKNPLTSYLELSKYCDKIFIADISITKNTIELLKIIKKGIVPIPIENIDLEEKFLNVPLTIRIDSNHLVLRIEESRFSLKTSKVIKPENVINRKKGAVTIDNELGKRYSGEIMIAKKDLSKRESLNVIAYIKDDYIDLIDHIENGMKIIFVK